MIASCLAEYLCLPTLQCGCCWTFATTGITECINAMYTGEVVSVSEQQLIDCDTAKPYEDAGCEGGDFTG